jgi:hypothetical protein
MPELNERAMQDVHKAVFLCQAYPDKTIREIASLMELGAVDINNALWRAEDLKFIEVEEQRTFKILKTPETWELGEDVAYLREQLLYTFSHMARSEADIEENYLGNMTKGYPAHDVAIVMKQLLSDGTVVDYQLTNSTEMPLSKKAKGRGEKPEIVKDTYTFYTLAENVEHQWGKKQFGDESRVK